MTHNEIASAVRNHVVDGLSGAVSDQEFSIHQLHDEVDLTRASLVYALSLTQKIDLGSLSQTKSNIPVVCRSMNSACDFYLPGDSIPSISIPKISRLGKGSPILYLGTNDMRDPIDVYYNITDIRDHEIRMTTKHRPFAWVDLGSENGTGMTDIWLFNTESYIGLKFLKVIGVYDYPAQVISEYSMDETEYPAPPSIQLQIINTLTEKYIRYYRSLNVLPLGNEQADSLVPQPTAPQQQQQQ
jgi:hypothetical protein